MIWNFKRFFHFLQKLHARTLGEVKPTNEKVEQLIGPILKKGGFY